MDNIGENRKQKLKSKKSPALTLKNLTGAFVVLLLGFSLSLLAFLCEKIVSMPSRNRRRLEQAQRISNNRQILSKKILEQAKMKEETVSTLATINQ